MVTAALRDRLARKLSAEYDANARYCSVLARTLNVRVCARPNILAREISKMPRGLAAMRVLFGLQGGELGGGLVGQGLPILEDFEAETVTDGVAASFGDV